MRKRVSMKDMAEELGVSTTLVSYVLNGKFLDRINPDTAERIKSHAKSVGYFPNQIAKSLRSDKTYTIGLVIADISNLYYSSIARFIEDESEKNNFNVIFGSADESLSKFKNLVQVFLSRQVDGLILATPAGAEPFIEDLKRQGIPFVLFDRFFPDVSDINSVTIDNYKASYDVVRMLKDKMFKRPTLITIESELFHMKERSRGFTEACQKLLDNSTPKVIEIPEDELTKQLEPVLLEIVKNKEVDAVYFTTNRVAMEGLRVFVKNNIRVPQDLGVVCFDEAEAYNLFTTSITYVKQPLQNIGKEAVKVLVSQINGEDSAKGIVFNTEIVFGNSIELQQKNH